MANSYDISERSPSPKRSCCGLGLFGKSSKSNKETPDSQDTKNVDAVFEGESVSKSPVKEEVDSNSNSTPMEKENVNPVTKPCVDEANASPDSTIHVKEAKNYDKVEEEEANVVSLEIADEIQSSDNPEGHSDVITSEPSVDSKSRSNDLTLFRKASIQVVEEVFHLDHVGTSRSSEDCEDCNCGVPVEITDLLHEAVEKWIQDFYSMDETKAFFQEHHTKEEMITLMGELRAEFIKTKEQINHEISDKSQPDQEINDRKQNAQSSWRKIRSFLRWSPFVQVFKKHKYPWVQLAGHQGNFHAGEAGSVLKRLDQRELHCYEKLVKDETLKGFYPEFRGQKKKEDDQFIQLQDLLANFNSPCVMDVKMGVRTYLEDELHKARKNPTQRKDMYTKMIEIDANAPTSEEHERKSVTKPRYMQWRDEMSSSHLLGFRVEGIKKSDGHSSKDFKKTKSRDDVMEVLRSFTGESEVIVTKYINRLKEIMAAQESSQFFSSHEVVGSSLLFVHDAQEQVSVWMIDFGKTEKLPENLSVNHRSPWVEGNHEDGYLYGLDNLVSIFEEVQTNLTSSPV